jgi:hypothetical protein
MPIGAVVFTEHWIFPRLGLERFRAERRRWVFNWAVLGVWPGTIVVCFLLPIHLYFKWLPGWFIAAAAYTVIMALTKGRPREAAAVTGGPAKAEGRT